MTQSAAPVVFPKLCFPISSNTCTLVTCSNMYVMVLLMGIHRLYFTMVLLDFSLTVKAAPHECLIRTSQP